MLFRRSVSLFTLVSFSMMFIFSCQSNSNGITAKFAPSDDKVLMIIGQDSDTIGDYVAQVPEVNIEGVTLYTQIKSADPSKTLLGMFYVGNCCF